jgi:hypothetical protein
VPPEQQQGIELLRRAVEAGLRYHEAVAKSTLDYLSTLGDLAREAGPATVRVGQPPAAAPAPPPPALVLEAEAGGTAVGAFMVENGRGEPISAPVTASTFAAAGHGEVEQKLAFEPEVVTLEAGEQVLVRVAALIGDGLQEGVGYRGEIAVPGAAAAGVPVVLRRRAAAG